MDWPPGSNGTSPCQIAWSIGHAANHRRGTRNGLGDGWPAGCLAGRHQSFRQWILEDSFSNGRPPLEEVGIQIVSNVEPYETMKPRLLNGAHQAVAYLGYLAGYRYVHDAMGYRHLRLMVARLMDEEITPLLPPVSDVDLPDY